MDTSPAEHAFRKMESQLDELIFVAMPELGAMGLAYTDRSTRSYHYKESYLRWEVAFERQWQSDLFTQQVQIILSYGEPKKPGEPAVVGVFRRAESFMQGQTSSVDSKYEGSVSFDAVCAEGVAGLVRPHLIAAATLLNVPL
jgi:hypothetical protein